MAKETAAKETAELADYAASCRYEDIPPDVVDRAKQCITDTSERDAVLRHHDVSGVGKVVDARHLVVAGDVDGGDIPRPHSRARCVNPRSPVRTCAP